MFPERMMVIDDDPLVPSMRACGASLAQGYLMSRALPIDQFIDWGKAIDWHYELPSQVLAKTLAVG